jgi:SAM-dependent methyltransferase
MTEIANTGERILPEKESALMIARHFSAYWFAKEYARGKKVLEIGSGEGYGTNFLAQFAAEVTGIDYNKEAVEFASNKYKRTNLKYISADAADLRLLKKKFDLICSFQVIEHIPDDKAFLKDTRELLSGEGVFICSTPNRLDASPGSTVPFNKFHLREYLLNDFRQLLSSSFSQVEILGLKRGPALKFFRRLKKSGIFNFLPSSLDPVKKFYSRVSPDNFLITKAADTGSLDFIGVCKI